MSVALKNRFSSRTAGMNQRKPVWVCRACDLWHNAPKPSRCLSCDAKQFYYFASRMEASRYAELALLQKHGFIRDLETQPEFPIEVNGVHIRNYRADFRYTNNRGEQVIEDVKPSRFRDEIYKLKRDLVQALYQVLITEVEK